MYVQDYFYDMLVNEQAPIRMTEKWFRTNFQEKYVQLTNIVWPKDFTFLQKLYHFSHNDIDLNLGKCKICGKRCSFINFKQGYKTYCSNKCSASSNETKEKFHNSCEKRFGARSPMQSKEIQEKHKKSCIKNFGKETPFHSKEIQDKIKKRNIENFGCESPIQVKEIRDKIKNTNLEKFGVEFPLQSEVIRKKTAHTCLKNYGNEYPFQSEEIQKKIKQTNIEKYGAESPFYDKNIQEKSKQTIIDKYGVKYPMQNENIQEKSKQTCLDRYGVENPMQYADIKEKVKQTNLDRYGVEWYCMTNDARNYSNDSKPNKYFANLLDENSISYEREFPLEHFSYDFKIDNILIEINPTITHNSHLNIFAGEPKDKNYHLDKSSIAEKHGYNCIHVWDWDDMNKILNMLKPKETLYARKLVLKEVSEKECNDFLNAYHFQNTCKGQTIRYGLYKDDLLVMVMTFGKPRYNKNYELELLRLCSHKDYIIVGGTEKIFKYILDKFNPESIISYCDNSKFNGEVYEKLGFKKYKRTIPSKHWYNQKSKKHITDNFLRQRGFDQLFGTNFGKNTSNEEIMIQYGFLPVFDCGQMTFVWKLEKRFL